MQSKNRSFSILALAIAVVAFSTLTFAQETKTEAPKADKAPKAERIEKRGLGGRKFGRMGRMGRMGHMGRMRGVGLRGLNLTDDQKAKLNTLREANRPSQALRDELKAIHEARKAGTITEAQKTRVAAIRDEMQGKRKAAHDQIQNILTAEQKAQIEARKAEMKQRMETMRKRFEERRKPRPADPTKPAAPAKPVI